MLEEEQLTTGAEHSSDPASAASAAPGRRTRADGERTRSAILEAAGALATTEGLEGLSIARLADRAGMSKSGLYAHFGSKEELQLATIAEAERIFRREVLDPARAEPDGVPRVLAQVDAYLSYLERRVFPGGCFFAATSTELGAQEGVVADRLRSLNRAALEDLGERLEVARREEQIGGSSDPRQLAFEIDALMLGAHAAYRLFSDVHDLERARRAVRGRLDQARSGR